jgi:hypothetical protein
MKIPQGAQSVTFCLRDYLGREIINQNGAKEYPAQFEIKAKKESVSW